jgi:DNA-binding NarL/FixJ family response regulator
MSLSAAGLVGRDRELSLLAAALERVIAGRGGVVWITGEPGIGKSALVLALTGAATEAGCAVRSAAGDELTEAFPLRLMADCLYIKVHAADPDIVEVARFLAGELTTPTVVDPVNTAAERMLGIVDRLCATAPLVLVAEDLHWADQPSLGLWSRLAHSIDQIPLLLVGSCRPVPHRPALERLGVAVERLDGMLLEVGPLNDTDAVTAARHLLAAQPGPRLSAELARTGGNPLYLRELVEALRDDGSVRVANDQAELVRTGGALPQSLAAAIGQQLTFLSPRTRQSLRLAALLGAEFGAAEWAHAAGQSPLQLTETVQEAIDGGVIAADEHTLRFRHDLIRQVLLEQTPPAVRDEVNLRVAHSLADAGYTADIIARQLVATSTLNDWARTWLTHATETLLRSAPQAYESLLLRANSLLEPGGDYRWEALASRLAQTQFWLGHDQAAEQTATTVLRHTSNPELAGQMGLHAVRAAGRQFNYERALALAGDILNTHPTLPARWQARLRAWKAFALFCLEQLEAATAEAAEALDRAREYDDRLGIAYASRVLGLADPSGGRALIASAIDSLGDDAESVDLRLLLVSDYLLYLRRDGIADEADAMVPNALVLGERVGAARAAAVHCNAAKVHLERGNWDQALHYAAMAPTETVEGRRAQAVSAEIMLRRGQREQAQAHLRAAGASNDSDSGLTQSRDGDLTHALFIRAYVDGDLPQALAFGRQQIEQWIPRFLPAVVQVALELDEIDTATSAAARAANPIYTPAIDARTCRALIEDDTDALLSLASEYDEMGWRTYRAFALEEAAVRLTRVGEPDRARAALTDAVQLYADFGASMDIRRADSRLRALGIRRGPRTIRHRPTHGWEALTPSELRIAQLVAKGLSNPDIAARLYVSRGTVQTHVSSILAKLHMNSRIELIRQHPTLAQNPSEPQRGTSTG